MRRLTLCLSMSCVALLLAACSSAPTHFYTLLPPATGAPTASAPYRIAVLPVTVPAVVDRPQMVVRTGTGSVALVEGERWIAPLGGEIRNAVSTDLTHRLGAEDVYGVAHAGDTPVYRIAIGVQRFESVPGQYTLLVAAWTVQAKSGTGKVVSCTSRIREPVDAGYAALAQGHQRGLQALAAGIASTVRTLARHGQASCPSGNGVH